MAQRRTDGPQLRDFVAEDKCWKRYIESELEAARKWSHKWGFLKTPPELIEDEKKEKTKPKIQLPKHLQIRPVTPVEKYITVNPSPPVPKTTQGFIGWRSSVPGLELERCFEIQSSKELMCLALSVAERPLRNNFQLPHAAMLLFFLRSHLHIGLYLPQCTVVSSSTLGRSCRAQGGAASQCLKGTKGQLQQKKQKTPI
ncbi:ciliary microtubule inner protein 1 isoform X1 [Anser cygnoides]|uniref:Ciliary microtubule inner protein 1 n=1 Tax=Anser brachyrhynchus TaxID=132585 RepID=A0A8B9CWA4_9AVES